MAFPSIRSQVTDNATANETTHTVSLPATISAGDTILVLIRVTVVGAIGWPNSDWNELFDVADDASDDQMAAAWKEAVGNEGGTTISVTSGNGKFTSIAIAVQDAANPRKTPPFLGTQAIGNATEPNAGNCNPNAGAKDYLWWTFYGMEGEQTGITAYPANYTLNQSGIVTTGTGGATNTNCTMASAARQLNASSEDTGVWDVTGILEEWTAYTIAFHPSESVGSQIFPPTFPAKYVGATALTIAVNLLQTTLAPVQDPFFQNDWPNPSPVKQQPINFIKFYNPTELETGEKPFKQDDWPNPAPVRSQLLVNINTRNANEANQIKSEYTLPLTKKHNPISYTYDLLSSTLKPQEQVPFVPVEYPTPLRLKSGQDYIFVRQIEENPDPFSLKDQPNPIIGRRNPVAFTFSQQLTPPEEIPFTPIDYPNPSIGRKINEGWTQDRKSYYTDEPINFSVPWPNPVLQIKSAEFWKNNNLQDTLAPPLVLAPPGVVIFPNPDIKRTLIVGISSSVHIEPTASPENSQLDWPNPLRKKGQAITWIQERDHYLIDIKPFTQNNWPNPALRKAPAITFIHTRKPDEPPATHPFVLQLANPIIVKRNAVGFSVNVLHYLETIKPIGSSQQDLPSPRRKRETLTWIQPRPFYYPIDISDPFRQVSWPNPESRKPGIIVGISTVFPQQASIQKPFKQDQWPNPILRIKKGDGWIDYFIYDSNQPPATQSFDLPLRKRFFDTSYIKTPQAMVAASSDPIKTFDYPNPVIIKRHPHSHIINLLQSTLEPAPGDKPFAQTDYPNPQVAAKIFHSGWLEFKKFYYEEPPIHIGQYDWPVFRAPKRNHVGYIDFRIGTSSPLFTSVTEVPITKKIIAITFIDNPALVLNTPASPDAPFRQQDWPIFVRVKNPRDFLGWIHQNTEILPVIKGRAICLLADDTEYNLIAMLEEYGLTAMITEFNLDAGGDKCE